MNKNANILAAIIVGTIILAGGAIVITQLSPDEGKVSNQQRYTSQADNTMRQAISLGISEWMMNGYSNQNKVWYSTGALPPDFVEAKSSLDEIVNKKVDDYMDKLRAENQDMYISPDVKVSFEITEPLDDDFALITAIVSGFEVGVEAAEQKQMEDISTSVDLPYKSWEIYDGLYKWMEDNAGQLTQTLYNDALLAQACQMVIGGCDCAETDFSEADIDSLQLRKDEVTNILANSMEDLNSGFSDDITCTYEIDMMNIQNTEKIQWTVSDVGPNGTLAVEPRSPYVYELQRWEEDRTLPRGDTCGGLPQADTLPQIPDDCTIRPDIGVDDGTVQVYEEPEIDNEACAGYVTRMGGEENLAQTMKVGMLAMDKKLAMLLSIQCKDTQTSIETNEGLQSLSAEVQMRISLALDCPMPTNPRDIYGDETLYGEEPATCPGGSCFPAGTLITMADGTSKVIEDVDVGDFVLSYNTFTGEMRTGAVLELESPIREGLYTIVFDDGSTIEVTNEHPFYTKKADRIGWASIIPEETYKETHTIDNVMQLEVGDSVMDLDENWDQILAITYNQGTIQTFNLKEVSTYDNFFADEKLVHNKCCFAAGTPVTMSDGSVKAIEDVVVGDLVLSYNEATGLTEAAEVLELQQPVREGLYIVSFDNGKVLKVTNDHPLMTKNGWAAIEIDAALAGYALDRVLQLEIGSEVLSEDMTFSTVTSMVYEPGDVQTYTLKKVDKNQNFFADGFLAHNQKMIGYIGLMCPLNCEPCYGCEPASGVSTPRQDVASDWQCTGPLENLICGKCGLCDANGECTIPQYAGYPCFDSAGDNMMAGNGADDDFADCWACDGVNTGDAACTMNPQAITSITQIACSGGTACSKCSGNELTPSAGGCDTALDMDMVCNDLSIAESERNCMICQAGNIGSCVGDASMVGEYCDDCSTCDSTGQCTAPAPEATGNCGTEATPCMKCSESQAGACIIDMSRNSECGRCEQCASDGSCEPDSSKNGQSCGNCKVCENGQCVAANEGQECRSSNGCVWSCQSGQCRISNEGASCTLSGNTCGLAQRCTSDGCETAQSDSQVFCCGGTKCNQGSPCCTYTEECQPCPSTT